MGMMDLSRLSEEVQRELGRQVVAVKYTIDQRGRQVVEAKAETKKRIGRSPDDADAFNLAWLPFAPCPRTSGRPYLMVIYASGPTWS